jgi:hypothetical protein
MTWLRDVVIDLGEVWRQAELTWRDDDDLWVREGEDL